MAWGCEGWQNTRGCEGCSSQERLCQGIQLAGYLFWSLGLDKWERTHSDIRSGFAEKK